MIILAYILIIEDDPGIAQPRGFAYWDRVNEVIQREPVHERDRFHMAMPRQVGIEKGKPFAPDEGQQ